MINNGTSTQFYRGDGSFQQITYANIGAINNQDISSTAQIDPTKLSNPSDSAQYLNGTDAWASFPIPYIQNEQQLNNGIIGADKLKNYVSGNLKFMDNANNWYDMSGSTVLNMYEGSTAKHFSAAGWSINGGGLCSTFEHNVDESSGISLNGDSIKLWAADSGLIYYDEDSLPNPSNYAWAINEAGSLGTSDRRLKTNINNLVFDNILGIFEKIKK